MVVAFPSCSLNCRREALGCSWASLVLGYAHLFQRWENLASLLFGACYKNMARDSPRTSQVSIRKAVRRFWPPFPHSQQEPIGRFLGGRLPACPLNRSHRSDRGIASADGSSRSAATMPCFQSASASTTLARIPPPGWRRGGARMTRKDLLRMPGSLMAPLELQRHRAQAPIDLGDDLLLVLGRWSGKRDAPANE